MRVVGLPKSFYHFARGSLPSLSPKAQDRFRWLSCWQSLRQQGLSNIEASEVLGLPRSTLYRWQEELKDAGPVALEPKRRRPRKRRQPTWSAELVDAVLQLREQYPRWGIDKLVLLLLRQGWQVATSMVGRILTRLKARGVLKEPPRKGVSARKRLRPRPYAVRKPKEY